MFKERLKQNVLCILFNCKYSKTWCWKDTQLGPYFVCWWGGMNIIMKQIFRIELEEFSEREGVVSIACVAIPLLWVAGWPPFATISNDRLWRGRSPDQEQPWKIWQSKNEYYVMGNSVYRKSCPSISEFDYSLS